MKELKLNARLSAYSKVEAISCTEQIQDMTICDVNRLFNEPCTEPEHVTSAANEVSCADIDALFL